MREAEELKDPTEEYFAQPLEDNLFEWHFTVRGPSDSEFDGGLYHGRIVLPPEYPMKPPNVILLTPSGRFEVGKKICLSISGHHPETWQPSWSIRTALLAIIGFMPTPAKGTLGSLDYPPEERKSLAKKSVRFVCEICGQVATLLAAKSEENPKESANPEESNSEESSGAKNIAEEAKEIARNISFKSEEEVSEALAEARSKVDKMMTEEEIIEAQVRKKIEAHGLNEEEAEEIRARKKASLAAQKRFRDKLALRTPGMMERINSGKPKSAIMSSTPSNQQANRNRQGNAQQNLRNEVQQPNPRDLTTSDYLILLIVAVIAVLVYRRFFPVSSQSDGSLDQDPLVLP